MSYFCRERLVYMELRSLRIVLPMLLGVLACAASVSSAAAQSLAGVWSGAIEVGGKRLPLVFHITDGGGAPVAVMDSPAQGAKGIPVDSVAYDGMVVRMAITGLGVEVEGMRRGDTITAVFRQGGLELPLVLKCGDAASAQPRRPQEPQPPFPYVCEEVMFLSGTDDVEMHGTLTLPEGDGPFAAVVLVTGSGTQNRDEELLGHKPFKVVADYLTRRDIAVLRYDDREWGRAYDGATTEDYAADALSAAAVLRRDRRIDPSRVGIAGHSEGGTIAFMCAARCDSVAFVISMAGMTIPGRECIVWQNRQALLRAGVPERSADRYCTVIDLVFEQMSEAGRAFSAEEAEEIVSKAAGAAGVTDMPSVMRAELVKSVASATPWFRFFVGYDPAEDVRRTRCDVLAMNGTSDTQVNAEANLGVLERCRELSGRLTVRRYDGLNHLFQHCVTGLSDEYYNIGETFSEEALSDMAAWIAARHSAL